MIELSLKLNTLSKLLFILAVLWILGIATFGKYFAYINLVVPELLAAGVFATAAFSFGLPHTWRWIYVLITGLLLIYIGFSAWWIFVAMVLLIPPLSWQTVATKVQGLFRYLQKVPFTVIALLSYAVAILWSYWPMRNSYFEGDEWVFFRLFTPLLEKNTWWLQGFIETFNPANEVLIHKTPLANLLYVIEFKVFGLNFLPYVAVTLLSHLFVTWSIYLFLSIYTKRTFLSYCAALLFAASAVHFQGVTWIMAALHTQLAVGFGFLSLYYLYKNKVQNNASALLVSSILLLAALWSKETAIIFIPLHFYLLWQQNFFKSYFTKKLFFLYISLFIFAVTQVISRNFQFTSSDRVAMPWSYQLVSEFDTYDVPQLTFWTGAFLLKMPAQVFIPHIEIITLAKWITDQQFPYFNQEKAVGGTTYSSFIYSPASEFVSYVLSILVCVTIIGLTQHFKQRRFFIFYLLLGVLPLAANILKFPWWGYTALIDSRHLYHMTPAALILLVFSVEKAFLVLHQTPRVARQGLTVLVLVLAYYYAQTIHETIATQQKDAHFSERQKIVSTLQTEISTPPKKLLIYTQSNRTYYGFASFMLPFQTAFSHMLPVIFSNQFHPNGVAYPNSFYTEQYLQGKENGLVTEGYYQDEEYGLGYFINEIPLIKYLERSNADLSIVYGYKFDGDASSFVDVTHQTRERLAKILSDRAVFSDWKRHGSQAQGFSFLVDPEWEVQLDSTGNIYQVTTAPLRPIFSIEAVDNSDGKDFATYVITELLEKHPVSDAKYQTSHIELDLDYPHNIYYHHSTPNQFYILSGNNKMFYKVIVFDEAQALLPLRSLEFNDTINEDIGF